MPAAARAGDRRPSAATASEAAIVEPSPSVAVIRPGAMLHRSTRSWRHSIAGSARTASPSARLSWRLGMFRPKQRSPISAARNVATGLRTSRRVASTMRMASRGAAAPLSASRTPTRRSTSSAGCINAVVRWSSSRGGGPTRTIFRPNRARSSAATSPAGQVPDDPRVGGTEHEVPGLRVLTRTRHVVEDPCDLRGREVRRQWQPGGLGEAVGALTRSRARSRAR